MNTISIRTLDMNKTCENNKLSELVDAVKALDAECNVYGSGLIHCAKGANRSPCFAAAFLMAKWQLTADEAYEHLRLVRAIVELETTAYGCHVSPLGWLKKHQQAIWDIFPPDKRTIRYRVENYQTVVDKVGRAIKSVNSTALTASGQVRESAWRSQPAWATAATGQGSSSAASGQVVPPSTKPKASLAAAPPAIQHASHHVTSLTRQLREAQAEKQKLIEQAEAHRGQLDAAMKKLDAASGQDRELQRVKKDTSPPRADIQINKFQLLFPPPCSC